MNGRRFFRFCLVIAIALFASMPVAQAVTCNTVASTVTCTGGAGASVAFQVANPGSGPAATQAGTPFPTTINVTGGSGTVQSLKVTLNGYTTTHNSNPPASHGSRDLGLMLVSPGSRNMELMRCIGKGNEA